MSYQPKYDKKPRDWNYSMYERYAYKIYSIKYFIINPDTEIEIIDYDINIEKSDPEETIFLIYKKRDLSCERYKTTVANFLIQLGQGKIRVDVDSIMGTNKQPIRRFLTKEEYNALPDSKLVDDIMYIVRY